ncbi:MAG: acyl-CoA dehydrogenase family protein [Anaerolineae bacterium]|nr:MAG: acyl-CoA dehydrogenase family protein [Anaerolineae bacterium]
MTTTTHLDNQLATIRAFIQEEVIPLEPLVMHQGFGAVLPALDAARRRVKALGLWAPHLPPTHGGMGMHLRDFARQRRAGRSPLGHYVFNCQAPDIGNMEVPLQHGSAEQARYLLPLAAGDIRSCFAMTEPAHAGSNPVWLSGTAVKEGDDYVLNGHKWFASSAEGANFAIVMAITNPEAPKLHRRASQIIVPTDTPGFHRVRNIPVMGETGAGWMSHGRIRLEDCRVPQSNRLGDEGAGFALAQERLGPGRVHHCMRWIGICERAFEMTCQYAARRELAPGRPLALQQVVQHSLADSRAEINAARLMVLDTADKVDRIGTYAARIEISLIKFYVANVLQRVLDRAIQVHGALGLTDDTILAFWFRHERARIYDGPDEVHKSFVARHLLKPYGVDTREATAV